MAASVTRPDVENGLCAALTESRGSTSEVVRMTVGQDGEIDSLEGVELVAAAETLFGITIDDGELSSGVCSSIPRHAELAVSKMNRSRRKEDRP
jgi:hypothetical protein